MRIEVVVFVVVSLSACSAPQTPASTATAQTAAAQAEGRENIADPGFLQAYAKTYRFGLGHPSAITLTPDGKSVLFLRSGPRSFVQDLYEHDVVSGKERVLMTASSVLKGAAERLTDAEKARRERMRQTARGIASYHLSRDGRRLLVPLSGRLYAIERASGAVQELKTQPGGFALDPQLSPDGGKVSYLIAGDLYVFDITKGREKRLTTRESPEITHGSAEFVAQEEMGRLHGNWWSPDSKTLVVQRTDITKVERLHIAYPDRPAKTPLASPYPRPGTPNAEVTLGVVAAVGGTPKWLQWDRVRWPYVARVVWGKHGPLTVVVQDRAQQEVAVLAADADKGTTRVLHIERDAAWVNLDPQMPKWLKTGEFLWTTERDGEWVLELRGADGKLVRKLTKPALGYRKLIGVDVANSAVNIVASADPTTAHRWVVPLAKPPVRGDGSKPTAPDGVRLSKTPGQHTTIVDDKTPTRVLVSDTLDRGRTFTAVGGPTGEPRTSELRSVAEKPAFSPNVSFHVVGDRSHRAMVLKPRNFKPGRKYPVIVYVYGGPHWAVVKRSSTRLALRQWIADHGYLVMSFDGRGTPHRGRAWERALRGNLIKAPMDDQVAALSSLGKQLPELDLSRVGIFGWSFGGYFSAMAVMRRPDVYKCAVAGAPVADWRDYDTHYTERYMGLPAENKAGYDDASVLTWAPKLSRPLLIVHGTADDNVYFTHAIKMSDALFRAGRSHAFLPLTGFTHMVADPKVMASLYGRILGHFEACL